MKKYLHAICLTMIAFLFSSNVFAQGENFRTNTPIGALFTGYYEYLPMSYLSNPPEEGYPLIIFIQGTGAEGDGSYADLQKVVNNLHSGPAWLLHYDPSFPKSFTVNGQTFEYIFIAPQFLYDPHWSNDPRWKESIGPLIDYCLANYNVNPKRVYFFGQSMGSGYIIDYLGASTANAEKVTAAVLPSVNRYVNESNPDGPDVVSKERIPLWFAAAEADSFAGGSWNAVLWAQNNIDMINAATPPPVFPPKLTIVEGSSHARAATTLADPNYREDGMNAYEWLLQYEKLSVVPVSGLELKTRVDNGSVMIEWSSVAEHNSASYSVERSSDATNFTAIGSVASKNSSSGATYSFIDNAPVPGTGYYRIRHVDVDGASTYSLINKVSFGVSASLKVYPNPVRNTLSIENNHADPIRRVTIFNSSGKVIKEYNMNATGTLSLDVSSLRRGFYAGKALIGDRVVNFTFVKSD